MNGGKEAPPLNFLGPDTGQSLNVGCHSGGGIDLGQAAPFGRRQCPEKEGILGEETGCLSQQPTLTAVDRQNEPIKVGRVGGASEQGHWLLLTPGPGLCHWPEQT